MDSLLLSDSIVCPRLASSSRPMLAVASRCTVALSMIRPPSVVGLSSVLPRRPPSCVARAGALMTGSPVSRNGSAFTVRDFMTKKENLVVVKPTTSIDEALQMLVENRITGFPVIDDDWTLVGVVSDYDLLALDSISGNGRADTGLFPEVDSTWKTFNEIRKLLSKTYGKVIGDVMTTNPLVVHETMNLEDAARLLLQTKYRRLPVVDGAGKLVGLITRGTVVRAALHIQRGSSQT
ncbi:CBS domain-containing protein CBSX1, chloroplastic-like [Dioscorea cayenensis subsp. rotundata]|uniref:CBS domain-containing protein CBSX1, chloroplastic-like n=1 Tax=Dioscorea cayennensis subsp. rotundata TaxID=55577 RepID=A0AB40BRP3_DIOCR|nr:CBS domain-containing protein CBSX1, chloroplastic-like [Dioscorea cayenensis subsp. rotundata]